uniref:Uncharacterized protein n=1 Tax=Arundo donax TaxID=35708 RepID=A0A0A8Z682_ARUDO
MLPHLLRSPSASAPLPQQRPCPLFGPMCVGPTLHQPLLSYWCCLPKIYSLYYYGATMFLT